MSSLCGISSCATISFEKSQNAHHQLDSLSLALNACKSKWHKAQEKIDKYEIEAIYNAHCFQEMKAKMRKLHAQIQTYKTDAPSQLHLLLDDLESRESVLRLITDLQEKRQNLLQELNQEIQRLIRSENNDLITVELKSDAIEITFTDSILVETDGFGIPVLHKATLPLMVHIADKIRKNTSVYSEIIGSVEASPDVGKGNDWQRAAMNAALVVKYLSDKVLIPNYAISALSFGSTEHSMLVWKIYAYKKEFETVFATISGD